MSISGAPLEVIEGIKRATRELTSHANLTLNFVDPNPLHPESADIRVSFESGCGHFSYIGTRCIRAAPEMPTMNLDPIEINEACLNGNPTRFRQIVLHEFGHALGCIHEHQQPAMSIQWDEDAVFNYYRGLPNKWSDAEIRHNVLELFKAGKYSTRIDSESIMLYGVPPELTKDRIGFEGGKDLSEGDIKFIQECYPKSPFTSLTGNRSRSLLQILQSLRMILNRLNLQDDESTSNIVRGLHHIHLGKTSSDQQHAQPSDSDSLSFPRWADHRGTQFGNITITSEHPSIPARHRKMPYLPPVVIIPIKFPRGYETYINPTVVGWVQSLRYHPIEGCDFKVFVSDVSHSGFDLHCYSSQSFRCHIFEISITWLAYTPIREDVFGGLIHIPPVGSTCGTMTYPYRLRTSGEFNSLIALTCLSVQGQDIDISIFNSSVTEEDAQWTFSVSGTDFTISAANAAFIISAIR